MVSAPLTGRPRLTTAETVPLLELGSTRVPENSLRRSEARISATAGTEPSIRNLIFAGDGFGAMSGTSKTKSEIVTLRPVGVSDAACPMVTVAVRPVTRAFKSASRTSGNSSTGRNVTPDATMVTARPSSGIGGPRRDRLRTGELTPTSIRCSAPRSTRSITHSRTSGTIRIGHIRFRAEADIGVPAKPSVRRGSPA